MAAPEPAANRLAPPYWLEISVETDGEAAEAVAEALRPLAYQEGVVLEQRGDADNLDPTALEPEVTVKIYLPGDEDTPAVRQKVREILYFMGRLYRIPEPLFRKLEDKDWADAWKVHYKPFRVGKRLWIQPSWVEESPASGDDVVLVLDPGMAFGTGLHPTTQMCLQAIEALVQPGIRVLDVGTGSGILAIAAARLGAGELLAVDTDRLAILAATENAARNNVTLQVQQGSLADLSPERWDLVLVNILAPVILSLLTEGLLEHVAPAGKLLLSGIIEEQLPAIEAAITSAGGEVTEKRQVRDWVTLVVRRC